MKTTTLFCLLLIAPTLAFAQLPPAPSPDLFVSVNGAATGSIHPGWPLIVNVTIMNSTRDAEDGSALPLVISPQGHVWTDSIQLSAESSSGQPLQWPFKLVGSASDAVLTLDPDSNVIATWQLSPDDVSTLPAGNYQLTASIQVSNSTGWNGTAQSDPVTITIAPEPALTADLQSQKSLLLTEYAANKKDFRSAILTSQQLVQDQPDNPQALITAASVMELAGYPALAFVQSSNALLVYHQANPTTPEAPSNLLTMHQRLLTQMLTSEELPPAPTSVLSSDATITFSPDPQPVTLAATVSTSAGSVDGGSVTFTFTDIAGSALSSPVVAGKASATFTIPAGTHAGSYAIQAAYDGTSAFSPSNSSNGTLLINKATPVISWSNPGSIVSGTALGAAQLNASANVPGTFVYTPPAGTKLPVGNGQVLAVTFTPTDGVDYQGASASTSIDVVASPGDLNGDGVVNCTDISVIRASFAKKTGQPGFDARADVNHDGVVNVVDLATVSRQLPAGTSCN